MTPFPVCARKRRSSWLRPIPVVPADAGDGKRFADMGKKIGADAQINEIVRERRRGFHERTPLETCIEIVLKYWIQRRKQVKTLRILFL